MARGLLDCGSVIALERVSGAGGADSFVGVAPDIVAGRICGRGCMRII